MGREGGIKDSVAGSEADSAGRAEFRFKVPDDLGGPHGLWINFVEFPVGRAESPRGRPTFEKQVADGRVIHGTLDTVIPKLRRVLQETRPSIYGLWGK